MHTAQSTDKTTTTTQTHTVQTTDKTTTQMHTDQSTDKKLSPTEPPENITGNQTMHATNKSFTQDSKDNFKYWAPSLMGVLILSGAALAFIIWLLRRKFNKKKKHYTNHLY